MQQAYLAVVGHANIDVLLDMQALPAPGESQPVQRRRTVYGGTACNVARHAAGLGVPTRLWARVGNDFPPDWRVELEDAGLDLSHLDVDDLLDTPTCFVLTAPDGQQSYCMDEGAMRPLREHPPRTALLDGLSDWLHMCTGAPEAYAPLAAEARRRGLHVAVDPGQEIHFAYDDRSLQALMDDADVLWCNEAELEAILRMLRYGDAEQLLDHVHRVVVTLGSEGLRMHSREAKPLRMAGIPVGQVMDPTGAGDALRAGTYAGLHDGLPWHEALQVGQRAAVSCLAMRGPQSRTITRTLLPAPAAV